MRLKALRKAIPAVCSLFAGGAMACTCLPFDEARVATTYKNIYVFEVEDVPLREKVKKLFAPSNEFEAQRYPIKVIQKIKGDVSPSEIFQPRGVPCESGDLERGMRILIYTNNDAQQIIGACNNMDMRYGDFDGERAILKIKQYMAIPEVPIEKVALKNWNRVPGSKDMVFEKANAQTIVGLHEMRIARLRIDSTGAPRQEYKSAVYEMAIDCKKGAYKLGDEYMYADVDLQGRRVGIQNLNRRRHPVKEGPNWKSIGEDHTATKLADLICKTQ